MRRKIAILEPLLLFGLIMDYIWDLRATHHGAWMAILGLLFLSHFVHRERAEMLGFRRRNLRECLEEFSPLLALASLLLLGGGLLLQTTRPIAFDEAVLAWVAYVPWGLLQQYILNGYFMNRFDAVLSRRAAPMLSAALFSGAHLPNGFLMIVTFVLGYCCARVYRRYKNLYFLGLAHATFGFLLFLVVPDSVSHHLIVGPGWYLHR